MAPTEIKFFHFAGSTGLTSSFGLGARFRDIAVKFQLSLGMNEIRPHNSICPSVLNPSCDVLESTLVAAPILCKYCSAPVQKQFANGNQSVHFVGALSIVVDEWTEFSYLSASFPCRNAAHGFSLIPVDSLKITMKEILQKALKKRKGSQKGSGNVVVVVKLLRFSRNCVVEVSVSE